MSVISESQAVKVFLDQLGLTFADGARNGERRADLNADCITSTMTLLNNDGQAMLLEQNTCGPCPTPDVMFIVVLGEGGKVTITIIDCSLLTIMGAP
jgi:hypothetical protein